VDLDLPANFQWFGLTQRAGEWLLIVLSLILLLASPGYQKCQRRTHGLRCRLRCRGAHLAGIEPRRVVFWVFVLMGALTGFAALLDAVRFSSIPGNAGQGLELKAIAAVVVGERPSLEAVEFYPAL
jgi:rhamnose transport system permease protein